MDMRTCAAFPIFHRDLLPSWCPGGVVGIDPVADATSVLRRLPLSPAEGRAVLSDWLGRTPGELQGEMVRIAGTGDGALSSSEEEALRIFSGNPAGEPGVDAALGQRMLLLAYAQEEHVRDIMKLTETYESQRKRLAVLLSDEDEGAPRKPAPSDGRQFMPKWQFVLRYLAPFLTGDVPLLVTDARLSAELLFSRFDASVPMTGRGWTGSYREFHLPPETLVERTASCGEGTDVTFIVRTCEGA